MGGKRLLVTGAGGMVGSYVREVFSDFNLILTDIIDGYLYLDVADKDVVYKVMRENRADYVLHLAAATDVDKCETEPESGIKVNSYGTKNVAGVCGDLDIPMVYISTGAVFGGEKQAPYIETDDPCPTNKYGASKYEGEKEVRSLLDRFYIVRASWMIGGGKNDKKFVGKIMRKVMSGEKNLKVVNDKFGSITYAKDLLKGIRELIKTDKYGIYHMTNEGVCSRYDIALEMLNMLARTDVKITPVPSGEFPLLAPRGRSEALENHKLTMMGLNRMQPWKEALGKYIEEELLPLYKL